MIGAAILKDVQLLLRDRGRLLALFALPVIFMVVFGSMFQFGADKGSPRPIAIYAAPGDARGAAIAKSLGEGFVADARPSAAAVRHAVATGDRVAGLVIPSVGPIELVIDLAGPVQVRGPVQGALTAAVMRALAPPIPMPALVVAKSPPGIAKPLEGVSSFQVTVPGNAVLFGFFLSMTVAMTFASERRSGTWRRLLAAPVPRWKALVGTLVPYFVIGCVQLAFLFGLVVPHSWALDGYYDVLVRQGTTLADLGPSIGALAGFSLLFALLGLWRFRFE